MKLSKMDGVRTCEYVNVLDINELAPMCGIKAIVDVEVGTLFIQKQTTHESTIQIRMLF